MAYAPIIDLRAEGLGRHLAMLLKGAEPLENVRFTIVCPSWSRETLNLLFESEHVSTERIQIISPNGKPYVLRCFELWRSFHTAKNKAGVLQRIRKILKTSTQSLWQHLITHAVSIYKPSSLLFFLCKVSIIAVAFLPILGLLSLALFFISIAMYMTRFISMVLRRTPIQRGITFFSQILSILIAPKESNWVLYLYDKMQKVEVQRMQTEIDKLSDIRAWYCPTAFWPSFNGIKTPRLMCVPDVVLTEFPSGFASVGGNRFLNTFQTIEQTIRGAENFVTYSETIKWGTLVDRYAVSASKVNVIRHAPNDLSCLVKITGFPDVEAASRHYCQSLLQTALQRSTNPYYTATFQNSDISFLFYASQLRPNKNVLLLLRTYKYLLRKRYIKHKLILTGYHEDLPDIKHFIFNHRLENDVLFLHGLSLSELAACYKLADLAVNPSLSEGGCPFTFTEALSVGTPVVMARISVTEEVLTDPELQKITFFDPYDWKDMANCIEWALAHREELLTIQQRTYEELSQRTWKEVANEYLCTLDRISHH